MTDFIEHPDHTGSSANPLAPWNQVEQRLECDTCGHEPEPGEAVVGDECRWSIASALEPCEGHYVEVEP